MAGLADTVGLAVEVYPIPASEINTLEIHYFQHQSEQHLLLSNS